MNELTREQILAMPAWRALDELVALHVMGQGDIVGMKWFGPEGEIGFPYRYSSDVGTAWEVEERFNQDSELRSTYMINLYVLVGLQPHLQPTLDDLYLIAHATPEQRCKAALLAVMGL